MPHHASDFQGLLTQIVARPGMYVGSPSLIAVAHYLNGYCHALSDVGSDDPTAGWVVWVEMRFGISSPAWHWTRILRHVYHSDEAALAALPELYAEFHKEREQVGLKALAQQHFQDKSGYAVPSTTTTTPDL